MGTERKKIRGDATVTLLSYILRDCPSLPNAACRGRAREFDGDHRRGPITQQAREICLFACPAFPECSQWVNSLHPDARPRGITAGQFRRSIPRKRKEAE
jgi:hypothetical protein